MTAIPEYASELLTAARLWYDAGYCVVPTHEDGGKRPFGRWRDFQEGRPSWAEVVQWLESGQYTGIGVICGATSNNVEMIEIEGPMDKAVERLGLVFTKASEYGEIDLSGLLSRVARGCVEQSAGGGLHLFIRVTDGPAKGNTKLAMIGQDAERKVVSETRGEGGFVVVAPTPGRKGHPEGASYLFINGGSPDKTVEVTCEDRDLLHLVFQLALDEPEHEYVAREVERSNKVLAGLGPAYEGESAFDAYRARATWREILEPAGWKWHSRDNERDYWVRPGKDPRDGHSASTVEDGPFYCFSTSTDFPAERPMTKAEVYAHLHHGGDLSAAARALLEAGYGTTPSYEIPAWEAQLDPEASEEERAEAQSNWVRENLPRVDWRELWTREHKEEWIVEPLIAARRLIALYSPPKVGKSLIMLNLAAAIAAGRPVLGIENVKPQRVLYVDFENDPVADTMERLIDMGFGPDDLDNLVMLSFPNLAKLDTARGSEELIAAAVEYGCTIIVIDTVSRAVKGEENSNDTWLDFYRYTGLKLKQHGIALIRLDHSGKDVEKGQRGGSAKSGDVDAVWRMTLRGEDLIDFVCEAQRFPITEKTFTVKRTSETGVLVHQVVGNPWKEKRERVIEKLKQGQIPKDPGLSVRKVRAMLRDVGITTTNGEIKDDHLRYYVEMPDTWDQLATEGHDG